MSSQPPCSSGEITCKAFFLCTPCFESMINCFECGGRSCTILAAVCIKGLVMTAICLLWLWTYTVNHSTRSQIQSYKGPYICRKANLIQSDRSEEVKTLRIRSAATSTVSSEHKFPDGFYFVSPSILESSFDYLVVSYLNTSRKHGKKEPQSFVRCDSFDHFDLHSLNDYKIVLFVYQLNFLGIWGDLIYRWKGLESTFPTVYYMTPNF